MKVQDLMTIEVVTVSPHTGFKDIVDTLVRHGISGVPVVDEDGALTGIVTEGDLLAKEAYGARRRRRRLLGFLTDVLAGRQVEFLQKAQGLTAADVMTERVVTAEPEEDVRYAARRMIELNVKRLPVVAEGRLVGMLSRTDVLGVFERSDESLAIAIERLLQRCLFLPPDDDVTVAVEDGVVTVGGSVRYQSSAAVIEAIVRASDGVVDVVNDLTFRERDPRSVR